MAPTNQAAFLDAPGARLRVGAAALPTAGPGELVVRNRAIAIKPLDCHMQDSGVFVQHWPAVIGCDVAGEVYEAGPGTSARFAAGDRVVGHAVNLVSGRAQDGAYALYTVVPAHKAARLPAQISFADGAVVPFALEAATCMLSAKEPGVAVPGVPTPALGLPYPALRGADTAAARKALVVYGGSSSVGSMTTQLAAAAGIHVVAIAGAPNLGLCRTGGAAAVVARDDPALVDTVVDAVRESGCAFAGIADAVSSPETYAHDLAILARLGAGRLACVHPPPADAPADVGAGMIFAVSDVATPVWEGYVSAALESGKLKCLPPAKVVGVGLASVQAALDMCRSGVSATKLVIKL